MKKVVSLLLAVLMMFTTSALSVNAEDVGETAILYITVSCENAPGEVFKEVTFAGKQWIVLNEDTEKQTALILMKDNYASGSYGQSEDNNAAVLYDGSGIDKAMNAFYNGLSHEDKNLIAPTSFRESVVINKRDGLGKPGEYLEAGDSRIDEAINTYELQGVVITGAKNTYTMERYVFAPSAKDIMDFGLEKAASTKNGGLLEYTALGNTPFENASLKEIFSDDASLGDYSSMIFFTRSADTTRSGYVYTPYFNGTWDYNHGKLLKAGIRPALNLDLTKVQLAEKPGSSAENPIIVKNDNWDGLNLQTDTYYKLAEDIGSEDTPSVYSLMNIPNGAHFDGDGFTIWTSKGDVFGKNNGEICKVTVAGAVTSCDAVFCNMNKGIITHCINRVDMQNDSDTSGICTNNFGTVSCCENYGDITGDAAAGICYQNEGIICNCINHGKIEANSANGAGICVYSSQTILNCVNTGSVNAKRTGVGICSSGSSILALCFNCGLPTGDNGSRHLGISGGQSTDCWYMRSVNEIDCRNIIGTNITAVDGDADIDKLLSDIHTKVDDYRKTYPAIELCDWKIGKNNLPTLDLCSTGIYALVNGICTRCGTVNTDRHTHIFEGGQCACGQYECQITGKHDFTNGDCICGEPVPASTASVLSDGSIWIIIAVAVAAVAGAAALVIVKKKKKPALAGAENTDE